jgi:hypothetical protein
MESTAENHVAQRLIKICSFTIGHGLCSTIVNVQAVTSEVARGNHLGSAADSIFGSFPTSKVQCPLKKKGGRPERLVTFVQFPCESVCDWNIKYFQSCMPTNYCLFITFAPTIIQLRLTVRLDLLTPPHHSAVVARKYGQLFHTASVSASPHGDFR